MTPDIHKSIVTLDNISKSFGSVEALKSASLTVTPNETVCLIGSSGSGKSTLLRCINQLEIIDDGSIDIEGTITSHFRDGLNINSNSKNDIKTALRKTGMVFQHFNLFPHLSVLDNIMEAPLTVDRRKRSEVKIQALELLDQVGLADKQQAFPAQLSGGQKQRVAIARALCMNPDILLCDEPTSALDPELVGEVLKTLQGLAHKITLMVVTHEMGFAREIADRVVFMDEGNILSAEAPDVFFNNQENSRIREFISKILN